MGLLIKLQNGDTQLKSLKFGKDRPGGGDSDQPYIQSNIDGPSQNPDYYNDFVLRGGIEAPISAAEDVSRLTKYLASPKGLLFITKQQLLSRTGTKTEASKGIQYLGGGLNEGAYNPLGTLAQAGTGFLGTHLNKQLVKNYQDAIILDQPKDTFTPNTNRLTRLTELISTNRAESNFSFVRGYSLNANNSLISYGGGPDSDLGIGKTYINFATSNYGDPDSVKTLLPKPEFYLIGRPYENREADKWVYPLVTTSVYNGVIERDGKGSVIEAFYGNSLTKGDYTFELGYYPSIYKKKFSLVPINDYKTYLTKKDNNHTTLKEEDIVYSSSIESIILNKQNYKLSGSITTQLISGSYQAAFQDSTARKFTIGSIPNLGVNKKYTPYSLEKGGIELYNSYKNQNVHNTEKVPFKITIVDPTAPSTGSTIQFPAYVESFSDNYNADWNSQTYMGRAEKFYKYNSFSRDISFTFRVAATSKDKLQDNYRKLRTLAASLAPTYTSQGYMAGNLHRLTFGNYVKGQYGILESVDYTIMDESPWETQGNEQLPFYIEVSCKFTPIHNFRPEYQPKTSEQKPFINQTTTAP
jgi:hypothetical protein